MLAPTTSDCVARPWQCERIMRQILAVALVFFAPVSADVSNLQEARLVETVGVYHAVAAFVLILPSSHPSLTSHATPPHSNARDRRTFEPIQDWRDWRCITVRSTCPARCIPLRAHSASSASDGTSAILRAMGHLPRPISPFKSQAIDPRCAGACRPVRRCLWGGRGAHVCLQVCFTRARAIETMECCAQLGSSTLGM